MRFLRPILVVLAASAAAPVAAQDHPAGPGCVAPNLSFAQRIAALEGAGFEELDPATIAAQRENDLVRVGLALRQIGFRYATAVTFSSFPGDPSIENLDALYSATADVDIRDHFDLDPGPTLQGVWMGRNLIGSVVVLRVRLDPGQDQVDCTVGIRSDRDLVALPGTPLADPVTLDYGTLSMTEVRGVADTGLRQLQSVLVDLPGPVLLPSRTLLPRGLRAVYGTILISDPSLSS